MPRNPHIRGVIPAVLLPRDADGNPLWESFDENARFLVAQGIAGLCVNGATGEYVGATAAERKETTRRARQALGGSGLLVSAVGATTFAATMSLARDARNEGTDVLLVPAPHFFRYSQADIAEYYRRVAAGAGLPCLIYNLPDFAGEVETATALELMRNTPGIIGIKDSSGKLDILDALSCSPDNRAVRLVGNDNVLAEALAGGLCDGTISGIAGVLPELTLTLWRAFEADDTNAFMTGDRLLTELLDRLRPLPIPWGLKAIAACRGWSPAEYPLPLSPERHAQLEAFCAWFPSWWKTAESGLKSLKAGSPAI